MEGLILINKPAKCRFCKVKENDILKYGPLYKLGKVRAHYFCVLLTHNLLQNGSDHEGMLGFLLKDIKGALRSSRTAMCHYCGKKNASIKCSGKKCPKHFHLPCGLQNGSLHQFMNEFKSFCRGHRPFQTIPRKVLQEAMENVTICCICYEGVQVTRKSEIVLWAPCCRKTWYHRLCVQKLAQSAGYFFKCAACNNANKFKASMQRFGIYVPQQDASWERVPNAFAELLHRHDTCDAEVCQCPEGRRRNEENTMFEIILCRSCGAQGVHVQCGGLQQNETNWECSVCRAVATKGCHSKWSPETVRRMQECFLKKAGRSSAEDVSEVRRRPLPAKEGAFESIICSSSEEEDAVIIAGMEKEEGEQSTVILEEEEVAKEGESEDVIEEQPKTKKKRICEEIRERTKVITSYERKEKEDDEEEEEEKEEQEPEEMTEEESMADEKVKNMATQTESEEESADVGAGTSVEFAEASAEREEPIIYVEADLLEAIKNLKPSPMSRKVTVLNNMRTARGEKLVTPRFATAFRPGPLSMKLRLLLRTLEERGISHRGIRPVRRRTGHLSVGGPLYGRMPRMSLVGMEPSTSTQWPHSGLQGMRSLYINYEDLSRVDLRRLMREHEVEVDEGTDGDGYRYRTPTRGVPTRTARASEGYRRNASTQTNFRVRLWVLPTMYLPLLHYFQRRH